MFSQNTRLSDCSYFAMNHNWQVRGERGDGFQGMGFFGFGGGGGGVARD